MKRVQRSKDGDLTAAEFAAELGINAQTLTYWKWRLGKEEEQSLPARRASRPRRDERKRTARAKPKFVEVTTISAPPSRLELVMREGVVVRVPDGFDVETLRRVMSALDAPGDWR